MASWKENASRYSILQVCEITGLCRATVYNRIASGLLRPVKDGGRTFISRAEIDRYLASCETAQ